MLSFSEIQIPRHLVLLAVILLTHVLIHVKYLNLPPIGFHQWRQTQTLSVARNFYEEKFDLFKPRVDSRGNTSGITGMEFPIVNAIIAEGYGAFGYGNSIGRVVIMAFSILAIIGCYLYFNIFLQSETAGVFSAFALTFSPLFCYYSIVVLPDIPALAFLFVALWLFWKYRDRPSPLILLGAAASLSAAGLIKVSTLIVIPAVVVAGFGLSERRHRWFLAYALLAAVFVSGMWILYATYLSETYHNFDFKLSAMFPFPLSRVPQVSKRVFFQWLPELYINYAEFVMFLFGFFMISRESAYIRRYAVLYAVGLACFMIAFYPMLEFHDYYMIPALLLRFRA